MIRYFVLSAAIVFGAILLILALPQAHAPEPHGAQYVAGRATPGPGDPDRDTTTPKPMTGDAPWALSAVPECFRQRASFYGSHAFAHRHIPAGARRIGARGARRLVVADCTLDVSGDSAELRRGDTVLRVPAPAYVSVAGDLVVLDEPAGPHERVRLYRLRTGAIPSFAPVR